MILNFVLNNFMTYRDRRLKGTKLFGGLMIFMTVCSVGAFTNAQIAEYLYFHSVPWWIAGLMGAAVGSVWNYGVSSQFVWRRSHRKSKTLAAHPG
jgi:dolichol-phosphate mannosyltransferase